MVDRIFDPTQNQTLMYDFINDWPFQEAIRAKSNKVFQERGMRDRYDTQGQPTWLAQSLQPVPAQAKLANSEGEANGVMRGDRQQFSPK